MKNSFLAIMSVPILLTGCAHVPAMPNVPLKARVEILDPKVDLAHLPRPVLRGVPVDVKEHARPGSISTVKMGIQAAVECNATRTECKHAMVLSALNYQLVRAGDNSAMIKGTFDVTVARRITDTYDSPTMKSSFDRSIDDRVEVIEEGKYSYPVSAILKIGAPYTVNGRLGTKVIITLQRAAGY